MSRCVETNSVLAGAVVFVEVLILRRISGRIAVMRPGVGESEVRIDLKSTISRGPDWVDKRSAGSN